MIVRKAKAVNVNLPKTRLNYKKTHEYVPVKAVLDKPIQSVSQQT